MQKDNPFLYFKIGCGGLLAIIFAFIIVGAIVGGKKDDTTNSSMAWAACEQHVREYLKAPSTAEFSGFGETQVVAQGGNKYAVIGWVDSQNSFGAKIRTKYICKSTDLGSGRWSFEPLMVN